MLKFSEKKKGIEEVKHKRNILKRAFGISSIDYVSGIRLTWGFLSSHGE